MIAISPWSRDAMSADDLARLEARADALGVNVSTVRNSKGWMVRVRRGDDLIALRAHGELVGVIHAALDDFSEAFGEPWTEEEILTIAAQSGLDVTRA